MSIHDIIVVSVLSENPSLTSQHIYSTLLTKTRAAGTAGRWQCGPKAAAPGLRWVGWRVQWRGSSDNPRTPGSRYRFADTPPTAGEERDQGPETTPEQRCWNVTLTQTLWCGDTSMGLINLVSIYLINFWFYNSVLWEKVFCQTDFST